MKRRFTLGTMAIVVLSLLITAGASLYSHSSREWSAARQSLQELLVLTEAQEAAAGPEAALSAFSVAAPGKRLTLIAADGTVLADTDSDTRENHADRPEFRDACSLGWGESTRRSDTLGFPMLYMAKQFSDGTVGRAAMPLSTLDSLVLAGFPPLLLAAFAALLLAFSLARYMAKSITRPLEMVSIALLELLDLGSSGFLSRYRADDELRPLLNSIDRLVNRLQAGMDQLKAERDKVREAESVRAEFTANVSHELKTPLTSIRGTAELLSQGIVKPEDQAQFFTLIQVETDRLISLINDILDLSELESVRIDTPEAAASPLDSAREVASLLAPEAARRGVTISVSGEAGLAFISAGRMKQLMMNLMDNAVKYSKPEGGQATVTVSRSDGRLRITVSDNGIGIPEEAQPHVFERFYRVDKSRSRQNGGTGLGLAIVKHICQLYGGGVALESVPGAGSTFIVTLPEAD